MVVCDSGYWSNDLIHVLESLVVGLIKKCDGGRLR